jgi:organic hydroperoxide reductase OsmC/OhrA
MSEHRATVQWQRGEGEVFAKGRYSRVHSWRFDGGAQVRASSSPQVVPVPWSDPAAVDPEEGYVAALSSCHMLWFLSLAAAAGFVVESYEDEAVGHMSEVRPQRPAVTRVILRPRVAFDPAHAADAAQLDALHHQAHDHCFLANSVKTEIRIEPR